MIRLGIILSLLLVISCRNDQLILSVQEQQTYLAKGDSLTKITFDTLRNTLLRKILSDGVAGAVKFCHTEAEPLSTIYANEGVDISRISNRFRNPSNKPDSMSVAILQKMQEAMEKGDRPLAQVLKDQQGNVHYFKPIIMQAMCLNCHGTVPGQVQPDVLKVIDSLYPGDLARQYSDGELRGAWHVQFKKRPKGGD